MSTLEGFLLGHIAHDLSSATNERVLVRGSEANRARMLRNQFVRITDVVTPGIAFLGRFLSGPFFPEADSDDVMADVEIQGELDGNETHDTNNRPAPGSTVHELPPAAVSELMGFAGEMKLGCLSGREDLPVSIRSMSKDVLPRNVGIFGTVGSGKSNSVQVLIEEASANGWAIILLDLEAEYVDMDLPMDQTHLIEKLARFGREPKGLPDFHVYYPMSCASERANSQPFTLRLADFDSSVTAELMQATLAERNALLDCIDHFEQKFQSKLATSETEKLRGLLDPSPQAKLPFTLPQLRGRAMERSSRNSDTLDYVGLGSKLQLLMHSGVFDQPNLRGMDIAEMLKPGRVNVIDVSVANDTVKNLVTVDLLRKAFAFKIADPEAPPAMLVIEERNRS